jgi:hypothetical protein
VLIIFLILITGKESLSSVGWRSRTGPKTQQQSHQRDGSDWNTIGHGDLGRALI